MSLSTLQVDDTVFRDKLNALAMHVGDAGKVLKQEAKMLMREIIARTPPQGGTSRVSQFTTIDVNARRQGELAIARDLKSIFEVIPDGLHSKVLRENPSGVREMKVWLSGSKTKFVVDRDYFATSLDQMHRFHQSKRSKATGRTPRNKTHRYQELGRNAARDKMIVSKSMYEAYRGNVWKYVGKQKGGWGVGAQLLGIRLPGWIMRHANGVNGYVLSNLDDKTSPSITIGNRTPGVIHNCERIVNYALLNRARFMERNLRRLIKYGPGKNGNSGYAS